MLACSYYHNDPKLISLLSFHTWAGIYIMIDDATDDINLHGLVDDDAADEDLAIRRDVDRDVLIDPLAFPL